MADLIRAKFNYNKCKIHILLFTLACLGFLPSCSQQKKPKISSTSSKSNTDATFRPQMKVDSTLFQTKVYFVPLDTAYLFFKVDGFLQKGDVSLKKGVRFAFNQLLAQLDIRNLFEKMSAMKSALNEDTKRLIPQLKTLGTTDVAKWSEFLEDVHPSKRLPVFPLVRTSEESALVKQSGIASKYIQLQQMESEIEAHFFLAPFDGTFDEVYLSVGKKCLEKQRVARLLSSENGLIRIKLPKKYRSKIRKNSSFLYNNKSRKHLIIKEMNWLKQEGEYWLIALKTNRKFITESEANQYVFQTILVDQWYVLPASMFGNGLLSVRVNGKSLKRRISIIRSEGDTILVKGLSENDRCFLPPESN